MISIYLDNIGVYEQINEKIVHTHTKNICVCVWLDSYDWK